MVVVSGGRVAGVVTDRTPDLALRGVLLPGLVNAHAHTEYGPSFADLATAGLPFPQWIGELSARRRSFPADGWAAEAAGSAAAMLASGTTCAADVVTHGPGIRALAAAGLAGVSYVEAVGADDAVWDSHERARVTELLTADPGAARSLGISPHTLYTLGTRVFRALVALAGDLGLRLHPHVAETAEEVLYVAQGEGPFRLAMERFGLTMELAGVGSARTPIGELAELGALGAGTHVAHGVHVDAADRALLRERGVAVALCPRSNAVLGAGTAPVAAYLREGNRICVGTDSLSSSPSLNLLDDVRALRDLARAQGYDAPDLDARLVAAATAGGAAAMGLADVGRLRRGARADLVLVEGPASDDPHATVVGGAASAVWLAGERIGA